jgi:hypothetical protein
MLNKLPHASDHDIPIESLGVGHTNMLSVKLGIGRVLSKKYVPLRVDVFPAQSLAHKYSIHVHSVLLVIISPLLYDVHALVQSAALVQLYFLVTILVSVTDKVIGIFVVHHTPVLFALKFGAILSYIVLIVFDAVLRLPQASLATHAHTFTFTVHCVVGFTVQVYVHPNPLIVPFPIVTSVDTKLNTVSLNVAVTLNVVLVHAATADVNTTVGTHVSFIIIYVFHVIGHPHVSHILIRTLVVHSAGINQVERFDPIPVRVTPLSFDIATVIGDGHHELVILHVMLHA